MPAPTIANLEAVRPVAPHVMQDYAAWLVDLDGTLYRARGVKLAMAAELAVAGWSAVRIVRAFRKEHERMRQEHQGANGLEESESAFRRQLQRTAKLLALPEQLVERIITRWMFERPLKWVRTFRRRSLLRSIESFRTSGARTALVSDYPARRKLAALGASQFFDVVIANGEDGAKFPLKPSPASFLAAADRLGVAAADCLVIGDRHDADGEAAFQAGMAFCHVHAPTALRDSRPA